MKNKITIELIKKYYDLTSEALKIVKESVITGKEKQAKEIIEMVSNYIKDSEYFLKKNDFVNSFAALNYAHGWLDSGVILNIFNVDDNKLFTIK